MGERERILDHLENEYTEPVRDPVWQHIFISPALLAIAEHAQFQKLDRIRQLGPASLVYPGATHTRRSHSLGVFHIARRMITTLVRKGLATTDAPVSGVTREGVKAFLCAALLHDIGHYPHAHSLKDLAVEAHESLASRQILADFAPSIRESLGVDPRAVAAIVDHRIDYQGPENVRFYWSILSGVLDPDKLDYLNRDAYFCGVPYGVQDVDFILEEVSPDASRGIAISRKGITALENLLFSKYLMYKTVYWHKTVRIATAMIKKAIAMALDEGALKREDLYGLDDEEFFSRFTESRFAGFRLIADVRARALHKQVFRLPFDESNAAHRRLERVGERLALDAGIAEDLSSALGRRVPPESVIVDVPERISFEIDIPLSDPAGPGNAAGLDVSSVFGRLGGADFPRALRAISVCVRREQDLVDAVGRLDLSRYLAAPEAPR
jgi:HD superfamily phosphohydrolase